MKRFWLLCLVCSALFMLTVVRDVCATVVVTPPLGSQGNPISGTQVGNTYEFAAVYNGSTLYFDPPISSGIFSITAGPDFTGITIPLQPAITDPSLQVTAAGAGNSGTLIVGGSEFLFSTPVSMFTLSGFSPSDNPIPGSPPGGFEFGLDFASSPSTVAFDYTPQATPEPATLTLMLLGGLGFAGYALRRRKKAAAI